MKKKSIIDILAFICMALYVSCSPPPKGSKNQAPVLPSDQIIADTLSPLPSVVNIPIRMRTNAIEQMLNEQLTGLLYCCDTLSLGAIKPVRIKVWKGDSIKITLEGDELRYTVPLRLWLQFSFTVGALGFSHTEYQDVEAALALKFRSRISIGNNWKMSTTTRSDGYAWISDPVVKVRFLTIPIRPIVDIILSGQQKTFSDLIDKQVDNVCNVKNTLLPMWSRLQEPILISKEPKVWLRLSPKEVYMTPLKGADGSIVSSVGIKSVVETFFDDQPDYKKQDSLPGFIVSTAMDSGFVLNLYSEMNYEAATLLLRGFLLGREFKSGGKEVIVQDVIMTGVKGYALICLDLIGSYQGRVYVYGRPQYDTSTSTVSIEDLDFDLSTKNIVHNAANWMLHGSILSGVKPYLKFPLREKLLESQLMVQKTLSHAELMKNVYIVGSIDSLKVGGVRLTDNAIRATVFAKGAMQLSVHE
jgi:hypothetical protein